MFGTLFDVQVIPESVEVKIEPPPTQYTSETATTLLPSADEATDAHALLDAL
jgi:hypothetical protein